MMFERILVPLDISPMSEQALPYAAELAGAFASEIDIITVCDQSKSREAELCRSYLSGQAEKLSSESGGQGLKINAGVLTGSVLQQIQDVVGKRDIKLIVMASHGRSGVVIWPFGSTAYKVLHRVTVPVLLVKVKEAQGDSWQKSLFRRILVALDGSDLAGKVVPYVNAIAGKFNSEVVLLRVVETEQQMHHLGRIDNVPFAERDMGALRQRVSEYLDAEARRFERGVSVRTVVETGNDAEKIIRYARDNDCSLIVLSSHGHSGLESWFLGSVTNKVMQASQKSLLFIPATKL